MLPRSSALRSPTRRIPSTQSTVPVVGAIANRLGQADLNSRATPFPLLGDDRRDSTPRRSPRAVAITVQAGCAPTIPTTSTASVRSAESPTPRARSTAWASPVGRHRNAHLARGLPGLDRLELTDGLVERHVGLDRRWVGHPRHRLLLYARVLPCQQHRSAQVPDSLRRADPADQTRRLARNHRFVLHQRAQSATRTTTRRRSRSPGSRTESASSSVPAVLSREPESLSSHG
ncbi:MAG: hypothetical protein ACI855_004749 [Myxococcota bacterium]|jgi:hypothetical protein